MIHVVVIMEGKKILACNETVYTFDRVLFAVICFSSSESFPTRFVNNNEEHGVIVSIRAIHSLPIPQLGMCYFLI